MTLRGFVTGLCWAGLVLNLVALVATFFEPRLVGLRPQYVVNSLILLVAIVARRRAG